ncbi:MAG TPA: hypothetical protein VHT30_01475 [Acidimicrobiales bacterium]|jgi:hypothetical protein|nr:hypothetical protein [Acidimicrobiales bacterium]
MSTEFKVVFEGELPGRVAVHMNVALQAAALNVIASYFPDPDGPDPSPRGPGGPVEAFVLPPSYRGIIFEPNLAILTASAD